MADPGDVVTAARTAIGRPYAWGAAGPDRFDCSGLVVWAYAQAGIQMPRTSQQQAAGGLPVARADLQPGDVVAYYPDASHIGLYVGAGHVIHASTTGRPVAEVPIDTAGPYRNARRYLRKATTMPAKTPPTGDPTWLEDVLRPALGDRLRTLPGWKNSGVGGTMGRIWGVIWHHTGNARESAQSIRNGRPDLPGPLAQLHIAPDGTVTIVAVGPCNHAGRGSWAGLPTDNANGLTIGIECAWPSDTSITEATQTRERWPDAQILAMRDTGAALTAHLGVDASRNISHEEWATKGPAGWRQGKWDPGNLDMDWFRGEITKAMNGEFSTAPTTPEVPVNPPVSNPYAISKPATQDSRVGQLWDQLLVRWDMLGGRTPVEALAAIGAKLGIDGFQDVR
ncbi:NlpC/P60 family protein [Mycolicibacter minnesotensis]